MNVHSRYLAAVLAIGVLGAVPASADHHQAKAGSAAAPTVPEKSMDIVETAVAAGSFGTLAKALGAAGLVDTLKGAGPFTVFAPTDEAFAKLPAGALEALLADKNELAKVLTHHVVKGKVMAADVTKLTKADTVGGTSLAVAASDKGVKVGGANVTKADIVCSNGVIHVVDAVILPR